MLDALNMEKLGIPAVCIGVETLVMTTGRGMARAHGAPDYLIASMRHEMGWIRTIQISEELRGLVLQAVPQVIKALCVQE